MFGRALKGLHTEARKGGSATQVHDRLLGGISANLLYGFERFNLQSNRGVTSEHPSRQCGVKPTMRGVHQLEEAIQGSSSEEAPTFLLTRQYRSARFAPFAMTLPLP